MAYKQRTGVTAASQLILTDDPDFLRFIVERVVQAVLEAEMTAHLHTEPYERSTERRGYRNGFKPRQLNIRVGTLTLQVPQDRDSTFFTQVFTRYQHNEKALVLALMEMYIEGVSTRKVREITEVLCGTSCWMSLVSELGLPHETEKIVRQGGDGKKHERRSMAGCQTGVYPILTDSHASSRDHPAGKADGR